MSRRSTQQADLGTLLGTADQLAHAFVSLSSDIALVIDQQGVITNVVQDAVTPMAPLARDWVGQRWIETVTEETRRKVELLLADVDSTGMARRRQVNHGIHGAADIPVAYTALRLGTEGPVLVVGRDLRTVAAIQQKFQDTQQELERAYWQARQNEARYRVLFQVATDAVLVVDRLSQRVVDGNHAAVALLRAEQSPLIGRITEQQFDASSRPALLELLSLAFSEGRTGEIHARLAGTHVPMGVSATPLRGAPDAGVCDRVLLRVRAIEGASADVTQFGMPLARLVDTTAEGLVVTDAAGQVIVCNRAFAHLAQAPAAEQVQGQSLASWLGTDARDLSAWISNLRHAGMAHHSGVPFRRHETQALTVDLTLTLLIEGDQERLSFTVRPQVPSAASGQHVLSADTLALALAIQALSAEVGHAPLGTVVQRGEHLVRGHVLKQALQHVGIHHPHAARELGISDQELARLRQSLASESVPPGY